MDKELSNFIKYCLGYVRLTRERTVASQQKYSVSIPKEHFGLKGLLDGDEDGNLGELISLETFYSYTPKKVPEDNKAQYEREKELANKIDNIHNKYQNDQFTKQIVFNFGYFEVELPIVKEDVFSLDDEEDAEKEDKKPKTKIDRYPLFALPVRIDKEIDKVRGIPKYTIFFVDSEIQVNVSMLEPIIGPDLYFQLLAEMGQYEVDGRLSLPMSDLKVFDEIWNLVKAQLKLKEANFDDDSFSLEEIKIALSPRANYFLAEDLAKLSQLTEEELDNTALTSWTVDRDLNIEGGIPHEKDLYFPFLYDKYQIATLSLLGNRAAIIQGPPGTGKSETISNILCHLAATGKRVLFVSQKAQALKVVKDKLKKLDVKYLFGYLPNPSSAQIGEEDEADGIAPQLSALGSHIERIKNGRNRTSNSDPGVEEKQRLQNSFNSIVEAERRFHALYKELAELKTFDISISDFQCFSGSFSSVVWKGIKNTKAQIESLFKDVKEYEQSDYKKKLDTRFDSFDFKNKQFCKAVEKIKEDISKTGYDRHINLFRKLNNTKRNLRLREVRSTLPREVIDFIDQIQSSDITKSQAVKQMDLLYAHCLYYENLEKLETAKDGLHQMLNNCGVSHEEFGVIDSLVENTRARDLDKVRDNVLRVQAIKKEMDTLSESGDTNQVNSDLKHKTVDRNNHVAHYIQNIVNNNIIGKQGIAMRQIVQKFSKAFGKSKKAFRTFDNLRKDPSNFNSVLDLIPIWIMELDDASRIIPLEAGIFDYVLLDEASQCNVAYTLPVMFRANRALFVGDSEQMRDSNTLFKSGRVLDDLAHKFRVADDKRIKVSGSAVQSVLDIAKNRGFMDRTLHYHYRSPQELIGFSNEHFYKPNGKDLIPLNSNYLTYKDTNRVMVVHEVKSDWNDEISDNVNIAEAKAILGLFKELRADGRYQDKSIGILSFFNAQATYIRELFEKEGFKEEDHDYKVSIVEGIQGDEKDIIIYSFVIRKPDQKKRYVPLTGEGGDINADINKGRVNVAFSRARLQVHCFVSMPPSEIPEHIWLKKYVEYVLENGEVAFYSTKLKPFDSYFEEDFYNLVKSKLKRGYKIQNQVESCGFKIDFVISNSTTNKRIAVECDGPTHFKDEIDEIYGIHVESDEERQRVLEAAKWRFYRIKYSDWIDKEFDRDMVAQTIIQLLK